MLHSWFIRIALIDCARTKGDLHAQKEYQGTPGYYRKHFFVPTVHSIAPISPTIEANIIESYIANHPFFRHPVAAADYWVQ